MTAASIILKAQETFPELTDTDGLSFLQEIHNELCFDFKLIKSTATNTSLVVGTRAYSLASGTARVYQCRYVRSATTGDFKVLMETSEDELDQTQANWRGRENSEPTMFFVDTGQINLVPAPDTATSGSYPQLQYEISSFETLATNTDMPDGVISYQAWIDGVKMMAAEQLKDERLGYYVQRYKQGRGRLGTQLHNMAARYQTVIQPSQYGGLGKV